MRHLVGLLALLLIADAARADEPAAEDYARFGAAVFDTYTHRQQYVGNVFNSQESERITQSSEARRLQFEYRFRADALLVASFLLPTRDETIREGTRELDRYHFPKQVLVGAGWDALQMPLSKRGTLELGLSAGVVAGIATPFLENLLPWAEADVRIALKSGSALQAGMQYAGLLTRGQYTFVVGATQRF